MPAALALAAPAKINLFLEVTNRRSDGYHDLESVFQAVSLADRLEAERRDGCAVTLECGVPGVPLGDANTVVRAALLVKQAAGARGGLHFRLAKNIPMQAGLGGGSSDAAAALFLANRLFQANLPPAVLGRLAAEIGSDVPFFLCGGACLCRGRGEIVTPLEPLAPDRRLTLVLSNLASDTGEAYRRLCLPELGQVKPTAPFLEAMSGPDEALAAAAFNRFETTVFAAIPALEHLHRSLSAIPGVRPRLSGSGAALWFPGPAGPVRAALRDNARLASLADELNVRLAETTSLGSWDGCPEIEDVG